MSEITKYIDSVKIKATDFNGQHFDDCPFTKYPQWLEKAISAGTVAIANGGTRERDYACWALKSDPNSVIGEPGDWIVVLGDGASTIRIVNDIDFQTFYRKQ